MCLWGAKFGRCMQPQTRDVSGLGFVMVSRMGSQPLAIYEQAFCTNAHTLACIRNSFYAKLYKP